MRLDKRKPPKKPEIPKPKLKARYTMEDGHKFRKEVRAHARGGVPDRHSPHCGGAGARTYDAPRRWCPTPTLPCYCPPPAPPPSQVEADVDKLRAKLAEPPGNCRLPIGRGCH